MQLSKGKYDESGTWSQGRSTSTTSPSQVRKRSSSAKLRHQDHFRQANSTITIEDAGIGMTKSAAPELGKEASGIHDTTSGYESRDSERAAKR